MKFRHWLGRKADRCVGNAFGCCLWVGFYLPQILCVLAIGYALYFVVSRGPPDWLVEYLKKPPR